MKIHSVNMLNNGYGAAVSVKAPMHKCSDYKADYKSIYETPGLISFGFNVNRHRSVPDIQFEEYQSMSETMKKYLRKRCENFQYKVDKSLLRDPSMPILPLSYHETMDDFIKTSSLYNKYKDHKIICLGRSPKWFLNTSLWMKDGIENYDFVAFSKSWYLPDYRGNIRRQPELAPTEEQIRSYRKYLRNVKADPESIVKSFEKTGKKVILTDYVCTGKGVTSFLEILGNWAKEKGILEEFAKSLKIIGIGSMDYMEMLEPDLDEIRVPRVEMPEVLKPYQDILPTDFRTMDYRTFREMLIDANTNECRSTFYPADCWTLYKPHKFKTGQIKNMRQVEDLMKKSSRKIVISFSPAMQDFRNLLNFRILDALNERNLLKAVHNTRL